MADDSNPGNFANRPKEEVKEAAQKGTQTGGFGTMEPDKQDPTVIFSTGLANAKQKDIASQGGQASSGSFEKGSEAAKEAGRKGGQSS
ncbi:MAG: hypothetical protein Q9199_002065 [Rusavskia elegans]